MSKANYKNDQIYFAIVVDTTRKLYGLRNYNFAPTSSCFDKHILQIHNESKTSFGDLLPQNCLHDVISVTLKKLIGTG